MPSFGENKPLLTWAPSVSREVIHMGRGRPPRCRFCGSVRSVGKGVRRTKTMGNRRIRRCKDCGRKFTPKHQKPVEIPRQDDPADEGNEMTELPPPPVWE